MDQGRSRAALKRVVILGGGFGGVYALKYLTKMLGTDKDVEVVLVNERNYFLFTPLLHEVATGSLSPETVTEPIRAMLRAGFSYFYQGRVEKISLAKKLVFTSAGNLNYDYLIIALGSTTNFFNVLGAASYALTLKTLADARQLKNRFIEAFEQATKTTDEKMLKRLLHFVVVGGGATGVELAAEMADFLKGTFCRYYPPYLTSEVKITLIHRDQDLVPQFRRPLREKSLAVLRRKGVDVLLGREVASVFADRICLTGGEELQSSLIVWAAGVCPQPVFFEDEELPNHAGRILVNSCLEIEGHHNVFVIGDQAAVFGHSHAGSSHPLPALAQVATKEAKAVAINIERHLKGGHSLPFVYRQSGILLSLGEWMAVGEIRSITLQGKIAWWFWRTVYLSKIISSTKKVKVMLEWTINIFFPRDISEW